MMSVSTCTTQAHTNRSPTHTDMTFNPRQNKKEHTRYLLSGQTHLVHGKRHRPQLTKYHIMQR
jgi:hypothetical protein